MCLTCEHPHAHFQVADDEGGDGQVQEEQRGLVELRSEAVGSAIAQSVDHPPNDYGKYGHGCTCRAHVQRSRHVAVPSLWFSSAHVGDAIECSCVRRANSHGPLSQVSCVRVLGIPLAIDPTVPSACKTVQIC